MANHQHERRGAVVHNRRRLGTAEQREVMLEVRRPSAPRAAGQVKFQIVVVRGDGLEGLDHRRTERRPAEVSVDDNAGAIDERLNARRPERLEGRADALEHGVKVAHLFLRPQRGQFAADDGDDGRAGQAGDIAQGLEDFLHRRNIPQTNPWLHKVAHP